MDNDDPNPDRRERQFLRDIRMSSPCVFDFNKFDDARLLPDVIAAARANPSPQMVLESISHIGYDDDVDAFGAAILNLIETKQPIQSLQVEASGRHSYRYLEHVLQSVARNASIQEITLKDSNISFQVATQLFQHPLKKLAWDEEVDLTVDRGSREAFVDAVAENDSL